MSVPDVPGDRRRMRASDRDRDGVAQQLRDAAGDGRITLEELGERLEATYTARTYGDLDAVVADLPSPGHQGQPDHLAVSAPSGASPLPSVSPDVRLQAVLGSVSRAGAWQVPGQLAVNTVLGDLKLDFTDAQLTSSEVVVEARVVLGEVQLLVPEGWAVRTDEVRGLLSTIKDRNLARARPGAPVLRVRGVVILGDLTVRHPRRNRYLPR